MYASVAVPLGVARAGALLSTPAPCFRYTPRILPQHTLWRVLKLSHARTLTTEHHETSQGPTPRGHLNLQRHYSHRKVRTLDPAKLTPNDYVDLGAKSRPSVQFITQSNTPDSISGLLVDNCGFQLNTYVFQDARFPPNTAGFLYYHRPPFCPPLAGEIRFRITSSSDPASFAVGSDLFTPLGLPWKIPLLYMTISKLYATLRALLIQDGLVAPQLMETATAVAKTLKGTDHPRRCDHVGGNRSSIIGSLRQAFIFRFGRSNGIHLFVGKDSALRKQFTGFGGVPVRAGGTSGAARYSPFQGIRFSPFGSIHSIDVIHVSIGPAICCFEPSTLPEHAGKRIAVLRVLHLVDSDPIRAVTPPDGRTCPLEALRPREGQLFCILRHGQVRPWSLDIDDTRWVGSNRLVKSSLVRILFENQELYGLPPEPFF